MPHENPVFRNEMEAVTADRSSPFDVHESARKHGLRNTHDPPPGLEKQHVVYGRNPQYPSNPDESSDFRTSVTPSDERRRFVHAATRNIKRHVNEMQKHANDAYRYGKRAVGSAAHVYAKAKKVKNATWANWSRFVHGFTMFANGAMVIGTAIVIKDDVPVSVKAGYTNGSYLEDDPTDFSLFNFKPSAIVCVICAVSTLINLITTSIRMKGAERSRNMRRLYWLDTVIGWPLGMVVVAMIVGMNSFAELALAWSAAFASMSGLCIQDFASDNPTDRKAAKAYFAQLRTYRKYVVLGRDLGNGEFEEFDINEDTEPHTRDDIQLTARSRPPNEIVMFESTEPTKPTYYYQGPWYLSTKFAGVVLQIFSWAFPWIVVFVYLHGDVQHTSPGKPAWFVYSIPLVMFFLLIASVFAVEWRLLDENFKGDVKDIVCTTIGLLYRFSLALQIIIAVK